MSAGELFDLIYPTVVVISAVISTWVLTSARKRFPLYISLFLAAVTFFLPLIVVPLYLILLFFSYPKHSRPIRGRFIVPCIYLGIILTSFAVYRYLDEQSVDAHLSRASFAKLHSDPLTAIQEFREALKLEDNAHTHKLLAATLDECVTSQKPSPSIGLQNWVVSETMRSIIALHYCWNASTTRASRYWSLRNSWGAKRVCRLTFG